jgi:RND family efflux transporter MFP subunit
MTIAKPFLALCAVTALALSCSGGDKDAEAVGIPEVAARTAVASATGFTSEIIAMGVVQARSGGSATLGAPAPTRVARILVNTGQAVREGQPLIELDRTNFEAQAASADADLQAARQAHERQQRLVAEGIAPRKDLEQAAAELARASAASLAAHRAAELAVLRSPINGIVNDLPVSIGAPVDANQPLVQIADPRAVDVLLTVTPGEAALIDRGAAVSFTTGQSAAGTPLGAGTVTAISGIVDSATRGVQVRAHPASTSRPLRIGETVFARIASVVHPDAITVPLGAVVPYGSGFRVFVVDSAGVAHARSVTVGGRTDSLAEITRGVAAGERVVTYGAYGVEDSVRIVPVESQTRDTSAGA